jgi:hypothetical protein
MDMKKILQAMDGVASKPVEGSDSMSRFLRVVRESEINQVPAMPDIAGLQAGQSKDLGNGSNVTVNADGTVSYQGGWGTYIYNAQGQHVKTQSPSMAGYSQETDPTGNVTQQNYSQGPMNIQKGPEGTTANYQLGADNLQTTVQENSLNKFLSIVDKNNVSILSEGAGPHRVALPVQMAMQHYQQVKETPQPRERLIDKYFVEAETEIMQRKEEKRALINQYAKTIAERVLMKESAPAVSETPIEMTGDANDPHIYGHEKANPMSLKGRIGQARAQLKELAQLAESDNLLAWEEICKKAKGGMFMGLEQNLEQIRHGIAELAAKRRKGGVASRGIDKHIG